MERLQAVLELLKNATLTPLAAAADGVDDRGRAEEAIGVMFSCVIRARCRRQDVTGALVEVAEMDGVAGCGPADANVFLSLLEACAVPRPPLSREADAVWAQAEVRGGWVGGWVSGSVGGGGGGSGKSVAMAAAPRRRRRVFCVPSYFPRRMSVGSAGTFTSACGEPELNVHEHDCVGGGVAVEIEPIVRML